MYEEYPAQPCPGVCVLVLSLLTREVSSSVAAAAGGAAAVLGGSGGGGERIRNEDQEALVMFLMGAMVAGILLVGAVIQGYKVIRKHVLKIPDKPKSFVIDRKIKCKSGKPLCCVVPLFLFLDCVLQVTT